MRNLLHDYLRASRAIETDHYADRKILPLYGTACDPNRAWGCYGYFM
jgi:hypothetical protein